MWLKVERNVQIGMYVRLCVCETPTRRDRVCSVVVLMLALFIYLLHSMIVHRIDGEMQAERPSRLRREDIGVEGNDVRGLNAVAWVALPFTMSLAMNARRVEREIVEEKIGAGETPLPIHR